MGLRYTLLGLLSENQLRKKDDKLRKKLNSLDYDSKEYLKISNKLVDIVNKISSKSAGKLPKREHGWYIFKD